MGKLDAMAVQQLSAERASAQGVGTMATSLRAANDYAAWLNAVLVPEPTVRVNVVRNHAIIVVEVSGVALTVMQRYTKLGRFVAVRRMKNLISRRYWAWVYRTDEGCVTVRLWFDGMRNDRQSGV